MLNIEDWCGMKRKLCREGSGVKGKRPALFFRQWRDAERQEIGQHRDELFMYISFMSKFPLLKTLSKTSNCLQILY